MLVDTFLVPRPQYLAAVNYFWVTSGPWGHLVQGGQPVRLGYVTEIN